MDPLVSLDGPCGQFGWTLWSVKMDPVARLDGLCGQSKWTLWSVQMDPIARLDGPCGQSGWTLWSIQMDPVASLDAEAKWNYLLSADISPRIRSFGQHPGYYIYWAMPAASFICNSGPTTDSNSQWDRKVLFSPKHPDLMWGLHSAPLNGYWRFSSPGGTIRTWSSSLTSIWFRG